MHCFALQCSKPQQQKDNKMQKYEEVKQFTLLQEPIIKDNIIILHAADKTHVKHKCVYFPGYRDATDTAVIKALAANMMILLEGSFKEDRRTKEMQFVISKVSNAKQEEAVVYDALPTRDISPTYEEAISKPSADLIPVKERLMEISKYTFPDCNFFYSDGLEMWIEKTGPRKKLTRSFIEHYNSKATMMHWFLPDWYTAGVEL